VTATWDHLTDEQREELRTSLVRYAEELAPSDTGRASRFGPMMIGETLGRMLLDSASVIADESHVLAFESPRCRGYSAARGGKKGKPVTFDHGAIIEVKSSFPRLYPWQVAALERAGHLTPDPFIGLKLELIPPSRSLA
jgi:hypothetical protein